MDENDGLAMLPLALVQAGGFFPNQTMSFEAYAVLYRGKRSDVSEVQEDVVDSGMVRNDKREIGTTMKVSIVVQRPRTSLHWDHENNPSVGVATVLERVCEE